LTGESAPSTFTYTIQCDRDGELESAPTVVSSDVSDECNVSVTLKHASGCPVVTEAERLAAEAKEFALSNWWLVGILLLAAGSVVSLKGRAWFPHVIGIIVAVVVSGILLTLCGAFGWLESTFGWVFSSVLSVGISITLGIFMAKLTWVSIGILGAVGGYFGINILYEFLNVTFALSNMWVYWAMVVLGVGLGGYLSFVSAKHVVIHGTSFIGTYMFMRGLAAFVEGFPDEHELIAAIQAGEKIETNDAFWCYFAIFAVLFVGTSWYQSNKEKDHEDLKTHDNYEQVRV